MAATAYCAPLDSELVALQSQLGELQAQQDAFLAEQMALAFALGTEFDLTSVTEPNAKFDDGEGAHLLQIRSQIEELQTRAGQCLAQSLSDAVTAQDQDVRQSLAVAEALQQQEDWKMRVAAHDREFASKLAGVDDQTWQNIGADIEEPFLEPPPAGALDATATLFTTRTTPSQLLTGCGSSPQTTRALTTPRPEPKAAASGGSDVVKAGLGSGPSTSSAAASIPIGVECLCCYDRFPVTQVTCAGADSASSSSSSGGCGHYFCTGCMTEYVRGAVRERKFPVSCPMAAGAGGQGCGVKLSREAVVALLEGHHKEMQDFELLEAVQAIGTVHLIYCPHKSCSSPLLRPDDADLPQDTPTSCPACSRAFCGHCLIPGWHHGYTCAQFQALPAHLRSAEDAAMLQYSARQQWKQCPKCKLMVERSEGCNHMLCRCGSDFCYACGKPYESKQPTAQNVHGTPACGCPLFSVPGEDIPGGQNEQQNVARVGALRMRVVDDDSDDDEPNGGLARLGAARAANLVQPQPSRPWRGGRLVSRSRCRHSASIHNCPQGVGRCWFWHDEDDEE